MQNEFEKQVQQKMEELNLVPSQPVWEKVEMQIRNRKQRRRWFLLLPLFGLFVAGGVWIGTQHKTTTISSNKNERGQQVTHSVNTILNQTEKIENPAGPTSGITVNANPAGKKHKEDKPLNRENDFGKRVSGESIKRNPQNHGLAVLKANNTQQKIIPGNDQVDKTVVPHNNSNPLNKSTHTSAPDTSLSSPETEKGNEVSRPGDPAGVGIVQADSLKLQKSNVDSIPRPVLKKRSSAKWKYAFVASAGASGLSRLNVFNGQKSFFQSYLPATSSGGAVYTPPSSIQKGLAFSVGVVRQKQVDKRWLFSVGLQYNYYSNSILVGSKIEKDTTFKNLYAVSQFFTNGAVPATNGGSAYSVSLQSYKNHYHFISLPIAADWQVFRNVPVTVHAGVSLQQMIQTNALVFDYSSQAYYHSNKALNRTQVFTEYGLSYSIRMQKQSVSVGPQLQYALGSVEKNNSSHHLFSYGLKAQWQLNKK